MGKPVEIEIEPLTNDGRLRARVVARRDGEPVHMDTVTLDNARSRQTFLKRLAKVAEDTDTNNIEAELLRIADEQLQQPEVAATKSPAVPEISKADRAAAMRMLESPRLFDIIVEDIGKLGAEGERDLTLLLYVAMTSRILPDPLGVVVQGASSGGKSFAINTVGQLIPPESKILASSLSANALHYLADPDCLGITRDDAADRPDGASSDAPDIGGCPVANDDPQGT